MDFSQRVKLRDLYNKHAKDLIPSLHLVDCFDTYSPTFAVKYSSVNPNFLSASDEQGYVYIIQLNLSLSSKSRLHPPLQLHSNSIFDVNWSDDGRHLLTASGDFNAKIHDIEENYSIALVGHSGSVKCIKQYPMHHSIFVTASRDERINVWDTRVLSEKHGHLVGTIRTIKRKTKKPAAAYTSFTFLPEGPILASVESHTSDIKFWDMRKMVSAEPLCIVKNLECLASINQSSYEINQFWENAQRIPSEEREGTLKQLFIGTTSGNSWISLSADNRLVVSSMNHCVYIYPCIDKIDKCPPVVLKGVNNSFYVRSCMNPSRTHILSGSRPGELIVWDLETREKFVVGRTHSEMNSVDWSNSTSMFLAAATDDCAVLVFDYEK